MSNDLLMELETAPADAATISTLLDSFHETMQRYAAQVGQAVQGMVGSARRFERGWEQIVLAVARGRTLEMHALRTRLLSALEQRLRLLQETDSLAAALRQLGAAEGSIPGTLVPEISALNQLKARVFDRWQSAEDLEALAVRDFPLTAADLDKLGKRRQPPAAYYAEESKPF